MRIAAVFYTDFVKFSAKPAIYLVNFFSHRWKIHFTGAINETNTRTTHPRGTGTRGQNPQGATRLALRECACASFTFPGANGGQL